MSEHVNLPGSGEESTSDATYADRLDDLEGATLAYIDWGKPNGEELYDCFERRFTEEFGIDELLYYRKPTPSSPVPGDLMTEVMAAEPDGVILAIADCGSCNSSVVVDAKTVEEKGIPTVQVITDKFLDLNTRIAESYGYGKLPLITVDHPTRYLDSEEVDTLAERIQWSVHTQLTCEECLLGPADDG